MKIDGKLPTVHPQPKVASHKVATYPGLSLQFSHQRSWRNRRTIQSFLDQLNVRRTYMTCSQQSIILSIVSRGKRFWNQSTKNSSHVITRRIECKKDSITLFYRHWTNRRRRFGQYFFIPNLIPLHTSKRYIRRLVACHKWRNDSLELDPQVNITHKKNSQIPIFERRC